MGGSSAAEGRKLRRNGAYLLSEIVGQGVLSLFEWLVAGGNRPLRQMTPIDIEYEVWYITDSAV